VDYPVRLIQTRAASFDLNCPEQDGFFDRIELDPAGLIRITGWLRGPVSQAPKIALDQEKISLLQHYRLNRPDVNSAEQNVTARQPGVVFEYLVASSMVDRSFRTLAVQLPGGAEFQFECEFTFLSPHYRELFTSDDVYHRDRIYGSGPSNPVVHPEVLTLAKMLPGPVLDFGCGSGALIAELKNFGTEARGLELDSEVIRKSLKPEVKSAIILYGGNLPLNFPAKAFASVFCSEVLEHIPDARGAVREIARLAAKEVIFTVPDISAIPLGFRHSLVPWHLLEGTHVNFFTQESLYGLLKPFFSKIEFSRIGASSMNDSLFFTSLVAFCSK